MRGGFSASGSGRRVTVTVGVEASVWVPMEFVDLVAAAYERPGFGVREFTIFLASGYDTFCRTRTDWISFSMVHLGQEREYDG